MSTTRDELANDVTLLREHLAENVARLIEEQELKIVEIARITGISRSQLHNVRTGRQGATIDILAKLARMLGVQAHELLEPPSPPHRT